MSIHSFHGIVRIIAQDSAQNGIFLDLTHSDGSVTTITLEVEPALYPVRDLLTSAINKAVRAADPPARPWPRPVFHVSATGVTTELGAAKPESWATRPDAADSKRTPPDEAA